MAKCCEKIYTKYCDELKKALLQDDVKFLKVYGDNDTCIEYQRVKHGYWVEEPDRYFHWHCSECEYVISGPHREFHYCPKCGTKMEGDK